MCSVGSELRALRSANEKNANGIQGNREWAEGEMHARAQHVDHVMTRHSYVMDSYVLGRCGQI